ncbi:MAG: hypothetical protein JOY62_16685 [Acidobacteriaceae bacterium]|nr:hypothetical protein [Acidobacteriaceae bacterium]MBV9781602.1 hypothetical protein [Acidobacteriaceae bacterium]
MKILLDECVPKDLCKSFHGHQCYAAQRAGFGGKKNSDLLTAAELAGFNVLITVDKSIPEQQNLASRSLALIILLTPSNDLEHLLPHVAACRSALESIKPGEIIRISPD